MITWLVWTTGLLALVLAVLTIVSTVRGRGLDDVELVGSVLLELLLLGQAVAGFVLLARADRDDGLLFGPYLVTSVLVMPLGLFWSLGEKSRWGTGVLALATVTVAVLVVRMEQIWRTGG